MFKMRFALLNPLYRPTVGLFSAVSSSQQAAHFSSQSHKLPIGGFSFSTSDSRIHAAPAFKPISIKEKRVLLQRYKDKVFNGKALASKVRQRLSERIQSKSSSYSTPVLGHIIVGDLAQSELYVKLKLKACEEVGIGHRGFKLPADITEASLMEKVRELSDDPKVSGVLVQLPLPGHLDQEKIINMIGPEKDVDGLHPFNVGGLALKRHAPYFISCTPLAVLAILQDILGSTEALQGKRVALVGRSNIVGMPMYLLLNKVNAFVTVCFSQTPETLLRETIENADVVIAACGVPGLVRAHWLKPGAVVVDVGINFVETINEQSGEKESLMTGDVEFNEECLQRCSKITPVPGGVGPMTVTMLMSNLVESWELSLQNRFVGQELADQQRQTSLRSMGILESQRVAQLEKASHEFSFNLNLHKSLERQQAELDDQKLELSKQAEEVKTQSQDVQQTQSVFRPLENFKPKQ